MVYVVVYGVMISLKSIEDFVSKLYLGFLKQVACRPLFKIGVSCVDFGASGLTRPGTATDFSIRLEHTNKAKCVRCS